MPRGGQFGYIFTSEIKDINEPVTVAHELGHGRFKLYHTFDKHYGGYEQGNTTNIMDYSNKTHFAKWQWDQVHDPAMVVSLFERDEGGARTGTPLFVDYDKYEIQFHIDMVDESGNVTYVTPNGKPFQLPKSTKPSFTGKFKTAAGQAVHIPIPKGALLAFEESNGNVFTAQFIRNGMGFFFKGYALLGNSENFKETVVTSQTSFIVVVGWVL